MTTIASNYVVTIQAVYQWLKAYGIPIHPRIREITKDEIAALWTSDTTAKQVASHLGIGVNTLLRRVKKFNLGRKPKVPRLSGPDSATWKGGHDEYKGPKPAWDQAAAQVRERDGWRSQ